MVKLDLGIGSPTPRTTQACLAAVSIAVVNDEKQRGQTVDISGARVMRGYDIGEVSPVGC